jgi:hypothetical protein
MCSFYEPMFVFSTVISLASTQATRRVCGAGCGAWARRSALRFDCETRHSHFTPYDAANPRSADWRRVAFWKAVKVQPQDRNAAGRLDMLLP